MWKNIAEPERPKMTVWGMRIAFWIPKTTNTHTQYMSCLLLVHSNNSCTFSYLVKSFLYTVYECTKEAQMPSLTVTS